MVTGAGTGGDTATERRKGLPAMMEVGDMRLMCSVKSRPALTFTLTLAERLPFRHDISKRRDVQEDEVVHKHYGTRGHPGTGTGTCTGPAHEHQADETPPANDDRTHRLYPNLVLC